MRPALPLLVLSLLFAAPAAAGSLRCDNRLVQKGDTQGEVIAKCGEPSEVLDRPVPRPVIQRQAYHEPRLRLTRDHYGRTRVWHDYGARRVVVHEHAPLVSFWTYNFGPNRLMHRLRFEDGLVTEIRTLGRGYAPREP